MHRSLQRILPAVVVLFAFTALALLPHVSHEEARGRPCAFCQAAQSAIPVVALAGVYHQAGAAEWLITPACPSCCPAPARNSRPSRAPPK